MPSSACKNQTCARSEEHTSELQSHDNFVCRLLLEKNRYSCRAVLPPVGGRVALFQEDVLPPAPGAVTRDSNWVFSSGPTRSLRICFFFFLNDGGPPRFPPFPPPAAFQF